jgi:alpha-glucosidase
VLDDDLLHLAYGSGAGPDPAQPIATSPMVFKSDYAGPGQFTRGERSLETAQLRLAVDVHGCATIEERTGGRKLTTICPNDLAQAQKGLSFARGDFHAAYGLGQNFVRLGSADGDWLSHGVFESGNDFGNHFMGFHGGADPQVQFPVLYAAGPAGKSLGLFLDNVYKQRWDLREPWWKVRSYGDELRLYVMAGPDLLDIRRDYLELTGTPPVPPRKAFGLWLSEFGFDGWGEIEDKLAVTRGAGFPLDGFVLDLQWFGGVQGGSPDSPMGGLQWDLRNFPDPDGHLAAFAQDGIGFIAIEESYVARNQPSYAAMSQGDRLVRDCDSGREVLFDEWMGLVGMIDWSDIDGAAWWHDNLRHPNLVSKGVLGHWTDLGEPEKYAPGGCYDGAESGKHRHADLHNLYNLLWHRSIADGYRRHHAETPRRPFLMSRAGAPGIQRFGAAMWSGDIASRLDVLATHHNAALHMAFAGIDYYSTDTGGFWRRALPDDGNRSGAGPGEQELYTQWFAASAWFDIPLRPHTYNCGFAWLPDACPREVSPAAVGHVASNLANLRQRYELIPYYYALAHRAYRHGEPVMAPLVMYYQDDPQVRQMGHQKLVGRDILVGLVASHGQRSRRVYLPTGTWFDYATGQRIDSRGAETGELELWRDGQFRLPAFVRAGAILPLMRVDEQTLDAFGTRRDGSRPDELILAIYPGTTPSDFTVYEDDGERVASYDGRGRPHYQTRTILVRQAPAPGTLTVAIEPAQGSAPGLPEVRDTELRVALGDAVPDQVRAGAAVLPRIDAAGAASGQAGWYPGPRGMLHIQLGANSVRQTQTVTITLPAGTPSEQRQRQD